MGCILAELLLRKPLFAGDDYIGQIKLIHDLLGTQPAQDLEHITSERAKKFILSLPNKPATPIQQRIPDCKKDRDLADFMQKLLAFNPDKRITVQSALEHPFLAPNRVPESEIEANFSYADAFDFEEESADTLDKNKIQSLMWEQIRAYHPYIPPNHP